MDLTKKIYTYKLDTEHPFGYAICLHPDLYQQYLKSNTDNKFYYFDLVMKSNGVCIYCGFTGVGNNCLCTLYDVNNNKPNLLNLCYYLYIYMILIHY